MRYFPSNVHKYLPKMLLALAFFASSVPADAALVYDKIEVFDGGGGLVSSVFATQAELTANPLAIFYVPNVAVNPAFIGAYSILLDAGTPVDIFGIASGGPDGFNLAFAPGGQAATYPLQNPVIATGSPIDVSRYLDVGLLRSGYSALFSASGAITIPGAVPEPATWAMLLVGFGAVGYTMRGRRQAIRVSFG